MNCLDQHPQAEKVPLGCSTKGNPTPYVSRSREARSGGCKVGQREQPSACSTVAPVCVHTCPRGVRSRRDGKEPGNACNSYFCMPREGTADGTLLQGVAKNPLSVLNGVKCSHWVLNGKVHNAKLNLNFSSHCLFQSRKFSSSLRMYSVHINFHTWVNMCKDGHEGGMFWKNSMFLLAPSLASSAYVEEIRPTIPTFKAVQGSVAVTLTRQKRLC